MWAEPTWYKFGDKPQPVSLKLPGAFRRRAFHAGPLRRGDGLTQTAAGFTCMESFSGQQHFAM